MSWQHNKPVIGKNNHIIKKGDLDEKKSDTKPFSIAPNNHIGKLNIATNNISEAMGFQLNLMYC
jgi:hypothetical protein